MGRVKKTAEEKAMVMHRVVTVDFTPSSKAQWVTYNASRAESARLWNDLVARHHRIRRAEWKWPSRGRFEKWAKGRYPNLSAQSVQQIIGEFLEAVSSTRQLRKNGHTESNYPWKTKRTHRDVIYTNQDARIKGGILILPNGKAGRLHIPMPNMPLPGRLMEVRAKWHQLFLVYEIPAETREPSSTIIGVDLGVNTLIAATDGQRALCISGRAVKADIRYRNKQLGKIASLQSGKKKGSRRHKKLQKRKARMLVKTAHRIEDKIHKATRKIANAFPNATAYVGKPFNGAAERLDRKRAQDVSSAANARIIRQLNYKLAVAHQIEEHYTSQTCPVCGERSKHRRTYRCRKCRFTGPRDVVGSLNIRTKGIHGYLLSGQDLPKTVSFTYPGNFPGSLRGHRTSCSPLIPELSGNVRSLPL